MAPSSDVAAQFDHHRALVQAERRAVLLLVAMAVTLVIRNPARKTINDLMLNRARIAPPISRADLTTGELAQWQSFLRRFVHVDGRVIDTGNGGVSHSEGQSYGMLFAAWANDQISFAAIWDWTRTALARPDDHLFAWRYRPGQRVPVDDLNDATDGNLMIAWALLRAGAQWERPDYIAQAIAIARDILRLDTLQRDDRIYLKPASGGFLRRDRLVLNLSYYNFAALRAMASLVPDARWHILEQQGRELIERGQFGSMRVPVDWVEQSLVEDRLSPASEWPVRFSWDAIRIPLNLVWSGDFQSPVLKNLVRFWANHKSPHLGAWLDVTSNRRVTTSANSGLSAIADLTRQAVTLKDQSLWSYEVDTAEHYYDAALMLLGRIAAQESGLTKAVEVPTSLGWLRSLV